MGCIDRVAKNGTNTQQNYNYAMAADVYDAVRGELAKRFVLMVPHMETCEFVEKDTRNGGKQTLCTMKVRFDFTDAETGEVVPVVSIGQGTDSGDKAAYKAMTGATKQCLIQTFLIPTGEDPEHEPKQQKAPPPAGAEALKQRMKSSGPPPTDPPVSQPPAPLTGAATHDRSLSFKFGRDQGKPLSELAEGSLKFYADCFNRDLADASKANFHEKTRAQLAAVVAELKLRGL